MTFASIDFSKLYSIFIPLEQGLRHIPSVAKATLGSILSSFHYNKD